MELQEVAWRIWTRMIDDRSGNWGMNLQDWDWVPGVGLIAMQEYADSHRQEAVKAYLHKWAEQNGEKAFKAKTVNATAPFAIFPALAREDGGHNYRKVASRAAEWLVRDAPRTREDALEHTVTENASFPEQVWADTVFMAVLFLARTASLLEDRELAEQAQRQVVLHLRLLQDPVSGVLFHGWNCASRDHMSAARWTRANAWVAAGVPMILNETTRLVSLADELSVRYKALMEGLLRYQQVDGLWSTVMDRPEFYREVSGSAGIGYGYLKAMAGGWLPERAEYKMAAERALHAMLSYVSEDGTVAEVSGGTPVMESIEAYNQIPRIPTLYGQGLMLMLISEAIVQGIGNRSCRQ
ncbi:glycoside hydrolase family 88/105 protein [Gorillibacterium massiliense]|uniref:glycoside hydrolase family 88/105 protein n=1 Tax=Gorillibacterium massiliense TaxID=1280390 RepID=UPI0004B91111|nr:glycoside hydrolase family 88 protein [Gorillibacterium massiliense]